MNETQTLIMSKKGISEEQAAEVYKRLQAADQLQMDQPVYDEYIICAMIAELATNAPHSLAKLQYIIARIKEIWNYALAREHEKIDHIFIEMKFSSDSSNNP